MSIQYLNGTDQNHKEAKRLVAWYGDRISHFGGGNESNRAPDEKFLWKPKSDSDGNLVVITPSNLRIKAVVVGADTRTRMSIGNGWRPHFRFAKPGAEYGANVAVTLHLDGGGSTTVRVPNGGSRYETAVKATTPAPVAPEPVKPAPVKSGKVKLPKALLLGEELAKQVIGVSVLEPSGALHPCKRIETGWTTGKALKDYPAGSVYRVSFSTQAVPEAVKVGANYVVHVNTAWKFVSPQAPAASEPLHSRTPNTLTLRADFAAVVSKVDALANIVEPGNPNPIIIPATKSGNTWTIPQPLASYPMGNRPNTWRIRLKDKPPAGVTYHTSIMQTFLREGDTATYPPTTRA